MTRVVATDLLLKFTQSATSHPTTTEIGSAITDLYIEDYRLAYPLNLDAYTDEDTNDSKGLVDNKQIWLIIKQEMQDIADLWHESGLDIPKPTIALSDPAIKKIKAMYGRKRGLLTTIQLYGGDLDDVAW